MQLPVLSATERAIQNQTSVYQGGIKPAPVLPNKTSNLRVLKRTTNNTKLSARKGARILKGPKSFRGKTLYSLTLVERQTCPDTCEQWSNCYGNNMPFAKRYEPGPALEDALEGDLRVLEARHPEGFVIRLHILGDFYSLGYVQFWRKKLREHPNMAIYGYTHRRHGTPIGDAVANMVKDFSPRVSILRSDGVEADDPLVPATTVPSKDAADPQIVVCPQQTKQTESCLTCGLCFHGTVPIQFLQH